MKKIITMIFTVILAMFLFTGCGMNKDDAKEYVQAVLDASYKGEFEEYVKITDSKETEAKELYEGNMEQLMQSLGMGDSMTDNMRADYEELFQSIFAHAKYTVGEVKEIENGFLVEVQTEQLNLFKDLEDDLIKAMKNDISKYDEQPTEEEMDRIALENMLRLLKEKVSNPVYGEKQTVTVKVTKDEDGVISISEEDLTEVDGALFC